MPHLENWSTFGRIDEFQAPETRELHLQGTVTGHSIFPDGTFVNTSRILRQDDDAIVTASGSHYTLGEPAPEFIEYCKNNGHHVPTDEEPIRFARR